MTTARNSEGQWVKELLEDLHNETPQHNDAKLEILSACVVLTMRSLENELIIRVVARGDFDAMNHGFITLADAAKQTVDEKTLN